ncbi:MAG: diguanylate cyclase [Desulfuromonadales bacterium C00003094]|jgi:diguanylate cyclase (GGDEF)-like protein|nr:MAG: diguanylate cyclase [Desulfuromonadales bacterium C00003094]OEU77265.1 MAG: diguanylate cyclase [Desulfuromonadales bacterium C00003107]
MFSNLVKYIRDNEEEIMGKILFYAQRQDYTKYTSSLKEAWRLSVAGLSNAFIEAIQVSGDDFELTPDDDYVADPAAQYGILQAHRHKERGITLDMFLGLMKYYRQSYQDLIEGSNFDKVERKTYSNLINRYFDRVEIGFCKTWAPGGQDQTVKDLQNRNRQMTNEKNKYLTMFESLSMPVFLIDKDGIIENMNHVASTVFYSGKLPGDKYYGEQGKILYLEEEFPWLSDKYREFVQSNEPGSSYDKYVNSQEKYFHVSFSKFLDVSGKFTGTIAIAEDITNRKNLEKELENLATTDPLTGAKNRRSFLQLLENEVARSQRYDHPFALLMMDIDHFKKINDTYGHDAGDRVLKLLVAESFGVLRGCDLFGRWGGEEFVALLPETDLAQAAVVAERLRAHIGRAELNSDDGALIKFTVSIGLTVVTESNCLIDNLFKTVDEAMYLAKEQGRNRVVRL